MTKDELVKEVARTVDLPQKQADAIVNHVFGMIRRALARGEKVEIRRFGIFRRRQWPARVARNPKTGAPVEVPVRAVGSFQPSKGLLRELLKSSPAEPPAETRDGGGAEGIRMTDCRANCRTRCHLE